jgi:c-di-GMP-binding flagellar brake protein YcgR
MVQSRRRSVRLPLQTAVSCTVNRKTLQGQTWNLSQGGMQVQVESLTMDETARFCFQLPGAHKQIDVWGVVVWVKNDRQGVRFIKLTPKVQDQIRNFVESIELSLY